MNRLVTFMYMASLCTTSGCATLEHVLFPERTAPAPKAPAAVAASTPTLQSVPVRSPTVAIARRSEPVKVAAGQSRPQPQAKPLVSLGPPATAQQPGDAPRILLTRSAGPDLLITCRGAHGQDDYKICTDAATREITLNPDLVRVAGGRPAKPLLQTNGEREAPIHLEVQLPEPELISGPDTLVLTVPEEPEPRSGPVSPAPDRQPPSGGQQPARPDPAGQLPTRPPSGGQLPSTPGTGSKPDSDDDLDDGDAPTRPVSKPTLNPNAPILSR